MSTIKFGKNLRSIGTEAFTGVAIDTLIFPEGIDSISSKAFSSCANLKVVSIPTSLQYAPAGSGDESVFLDCSSIDSIYWNAHKCPNNVFHSSDPYSSSIRSIEFGDSIQHIFSEFCMDFTALTNVILPTSLQSISDAVFYGCDNLDTIYCYATTPPELYDEYVFSNYNATLYIPCEAVDVYKADAIWGMFSNIQCLASTGLMCEDAISVTSTYTKNIEDLGEVWYTIGTYDLPLNINFIPNASTSTWGPEVQLDFTCTPGTYDDPALENVIRNLSESGITFPIELMCDKIVRDGKVMWNLSISQSYRNLLAKHGITHNIPTYIKVVFYESGTIHLTPDTLFSTCIEDSKYIQLNDTIDILANDSNRSFIVPYADWQNDSIRFVWSGEQPAQIYLATDNCDFTPNAWDVFVWKNFEITIDNPYELYSSDIQNAIYQQGDGIFFGKILSTTSGKLVVEKIPEVLEPIYTEFSKVICFGSAYVWNGRSYTTSGQYQQVFSATNNADSIVTLNLTVLPEVPITNDSATICYGETYTWNGQTYSTEGDYNMTLQNVQGCDSVVILHLTVNPIPTIEETIIACDSYIWNDSTYTQSGDYVYTTTAANGCDSIVTLHLTIYKSEYIEETVTSCDSYAWNGQTYTESGDYTYTITTDQGCERIEVLHLTIYKSEYVEETITACDFYEWNGQTYTQSGDYTYTTVAANGCDSIVTLHLTISPTLIAEETITACDFYEWNGQTYTQSGDYTYTTVAANGCDSIVTLHLTINQSEVDTTEYATVCYGETYTWNGQDYATEGAYTMTFSTSNGCDSTVTLHLTVLPEAVMIEESVTLNEEQLPYIWRGQSCDHAGVYTISEPFANYPYCDSVIYVLNLIVEAPNKCGDHLYWHYSNNTMTITGYGAMYDDPDILSYRTQDWYPARVNNIVLPDAITHIGNVAFADCANLTSIVIPSSVTSIGDGAFSWTGLQSVTIPASVTELGEQVFETCNDLRTILYESEPRSISNQTIHPLIGCVHLDTIIAPAALWHCTTADPALEARYGVPHKARYIEVTDGELTNQAIKYIANNSGAMEVLDLTNATNTTLPYGAWSNSYQLFTLYLPQQLEVIPESMVEGARNLSEIAIPATVMEIGNYAFAGCVNVWHMTVDAVIPPKVYESTFDGISRSISVQVPAGSEDLYREAAYWREFFIEHTNTPSPISNCQKLLRKDQILILRNGKVYTTMGQLITNE